VRDWAVRHASEIQKLQEQAQFRREFLSNISHEFKTPLFATQGYIETLRDGLLDYQATVYQDLSKSVSRSLFEVGGSTVLVQDSLLKVKWKITNEYRNIAGYDCRRANGIVLDSVYVVAFYTDLIPTPAGPGTVHGLPGMILGLAVPGQHFNIYATKVDLARPDIKSAVGKKRDKPMTRRETREKLKDALGRWMSDRQFDLLMTGMLL